jgi:hypothetical protein
MRAADERKQGHYNDTGGGTNSIRHYSSATLAVLCGCCLHHAATAS